MNPACRETTHPGSPRWNVPQILWPSTGAGRAARVGLVALLWLLLSAGSAAAIDRSLCAHDGVTEVPGFAAGRDSNQCLMIDPGNGDSLVPFQYEVMHATGNQSCDDVPNLDLNLKTQGKCSTKDEGEYCTLLIHDVVLDNYAHPGCKSEDGLFISGRGLEYLYLRGVQVLNAWKCAGGSGWAGPNGLGCTAGEDSSSHTDGVQFRKIPVNGGWVVWQESVLVNGHNLQYLHQAESDFGPTGSMLMQDVEVGRRKAIGHATNYPQDCRERGVDNDTICDVGKVSIGTGLQELWLADVTGTSRFGNEPGVGKVVIVAPPGFDKGWPRPFDGDGTGPGTCPNGRIASEPTTYCYESFEAALNAGHKAPPFAHLSPAGWTNPPAAASVTRPSPPTLLEQ